MWLTIEKLIALPVQKEEFVWSWRQIQLVKLIATTNQTVWGPEGLGSWDKNYRGGDYGPPWLPDVTCSVLHSRDNYHINLINGHPGGRERQAELRRYSSQVRLFHLVSHEGDA